MQGLDTIVGVDPNPAMEPYARQAAATVGLQKHQLDLQQGLAEQIPLPDASADLVICTLVSCLLAQLCWSGLSSTGVADACSQRLCLV